MKYAVHETLPPDLLVIKQMLANMRSQPRDEPAKVDHPPHQGANESCP